jgi:DNA-binding MarR family transcriptional regulator
MIEKGSTEYAILVALCDMPRPVRGMSEAMLLLNYRSSRAIRALSEQGLIKRRGWHDGPGGIWVPTSEGEAMVLEKEPGR